MSPDNRSTGCERHHLRPVLSILMPPGGVKVLFARTDKSFVRLPVRRSDHSGLPAVAGLQRHVN